MKRILDQMPPIQGVLPLFVGLLLWEVLQSGPSPNFPAPSRWWKTIVVLSENGSLRPAVIETLWTYFTGLAIAGTFGFGLGLLIGTISVVRAWSYMLLEYLRALPPPVIIPIAVLMLGYSPTMKITVVAMTALWPILLSTITGVTQVRGLLTDVARSMRMPWSRWLWKIVLPATLPAFLVGLRVAVPLAIVITLLVEMLTGLPGVGHLMITGQRNFNSAQVFGLLVVIGLIGFALNLAFEVVEALILRRWPPRSVARK